MPERSSLLSAALLGALAVITTAAAAGNPTWFVPDDGYFYLVLARNVARGLGSTFDGSTFTNGYHPLWRLVLLPFVADDPDTTLLRLVALCGALTLASLAAWLGLHRRLSLDPAPGAAVLLVYLLGTPNFGSELHLAVPLVIASLVALDRADRDGAAAVAGAIAGLAVLARLDLCFFAIAAALALRRPRAVAAFLAGLGAVVAPYLAWNLAHTGHLVPISGATKSTFPVPALDHLVTKVGGFGVAVITASFLTIPMAATAPPRVRRVWVPLAAGGAAQGAYTAFFTAFGWSQDYFYYYGPAVLSVAFAASYAGSSVAARLGSFSPAARERLFTALSALFAVICLLPAWTMRLPESAVVRAGRWIDENTPEDAVIFTVDAPGRLAFFGRRPVIALDGLTQDWRFDEDIRAPDLAAYLERRGVTHLWTVTGPYVAPWVTTDHTDGRSCLHALAPRTGADAGTLCVDDAAALVRLEDFGSSGSALFPWSRPSTIPGAR